MIFSKVMSLIDDSEFFKSLSHIGKAFVKDFIINVMLLVRISIKDITNSVQTT